MKIYIWILIFSFFFKIQSQNINIEVEYCEIIHKQDFTGQYDNLNGKYLNCEIVIKNQSNDTLCMPSLGGLDHWSNHFVNTKVFKRFDKAYLVVQIDEKYLLSDTSNTTGLTSKNIQEEDETHTTEETEVEEEVLYYDTIAEDSKIIENLSYKYSISKIPPNKEEHFFIVKKVSSSNIEEVYISVNFNTLYLNKKTINKEYKKKLKSFEGKKKKYRIETQKIDKAISKYAIKKIDGNTTSYHL